MMTPPRILSCGEVLWDLFPEGPRFGGAPANFACHAALLGAHVTMLSAVGADTHGEKAFSILHGFGIDTALMRSVPNAPTGTVGVSVDEAGKPNFEIHPNSAWDEITLQGETRHPLGVFDAVYFGTLSQRGARSRASIRHALNEAKTRGILRVLDVNLRTPFYDYALLRDSIAFANVLKLSDEELPEVAAACNVSLEASPEATLKALRLRFSLDCIAMTRGAEGALMVSDSGTTEQRGIPTVVVDTVGAGDSFTAALVLGLLRGCSDTETLRLACETASAACSHAGGVPQIGTTVSE